MCSEHSAGIPEDVVLDEASQRFQRLLERAVNDLGELVDVSRVEWFEGRAHSDGSGVRVWAGGHGEGSTGALHRQWDPEVLEPKAALLSRDVADFLVDLRPVGHFAYPHVSVHAGGNDAGQPLTGGRHVGQHRPNLIRGGLDVDGVVDCRHASGSFPRVDGLLTVVTAPCGQIHRPSGLSLGM
jgi:hypothetical protein